MILYNKTDIYAYARNTVEHEENGGGFLWLQETTL